jgi:hypothetical protein
MWSGGLAEHPRAAHGIVGKGLPTYKCHVSKVGWDDEGIPAIPLVIMHGMHGMHGAVRMSRHGIRAVLGELGVEPSVYGGDQSGIAG